MEAKIRAKRGELMGKGKGNVLSCMGKWKRRGFDGLSRGRGERKERLAILGKTLGRAGAEERGEKRKSSWRGNLEKMVDLSFVSLIS